MLQLSTFSDFPEVKFIPLIPRVVPAPLIDNLRSVTTIVPGVAVALSFTLTPFVPLARIEPKPEPQVPSIVIDLVIVTAPQVLGLLSDPFGFGWNLLHTTGLTTYNLILGAKPIWFIEIGFVVVAHIVGTLFAHILATRVMPNAKKVMLSQYPTLVLMVAFTVTTLWLLAQPLVITK